MKYVVTGGAGFIGSNIVEALVKNGDEVVVIDDLSSGNMDNLGPFLDKILFVQGSISDLELLKKQFQGADFVLHQAAMASVPQSIEDPKAANEVNVNGTLNVLLAAKDCNVKRVVYAGSCAAYGDSEELPKLESMRPNPLSPYALTKLVGEYYCQVFTKVYGLETVVLRYFNVFGQRQDPKSQYAAVIPIFINSVLQNKQPTIYGDGLTSRDFIHVQNVVSANLLACISKSAAGEVINVGSGVSITLMQLIEKINSSLKQHVKPIFAEARNGDVRHSRADISKARNFLSYEPKITFEEGMEKTVDWYKRISESE